MIRLNQRFLFTVLISCVTGYVTHAQSLTDRYLSHKIIVREDEQDVVSYVKPVKMNELKSDRTYYWFSKGLIGTTRGGYSGKVLNGGYQVFYSNKNLKQAGHFAGGLKAGNWKSWNASGGLLDEYHWSAGRKAGTYFKYDSLGRTMESGNYRRDLLHGKQFRRQGDSTQVIRYKNGKVTEARKLKMPQFIKKLFKKKEKALAQ